jgi:hemerythrin
MPAPSESKKMQTFVWDDTYLTGLDTVDRQHQMLVDLINELGALLTRQVAGDSGSLPACFRRLADYARFHFGEEERLWRAAGILAPSVDAHRDSHHEFVRQISTMWNAKESMASATEILHGFLVGWLGFHILGEDQAMARQVALIRAGESPAAASGIEASRKSGNAAALVAAVRTLHRVLTEQNHDLAQANLRLEERVAARTRELTAANEALNEANQRLERISRIDGLLDIANRRHFDERLEEEWRRAARERRPVACLMIDVDHFKAYNDRYGHQAGDDCLKRVARAAESALRRAGDLVARYGGEELAMLLPNTEHGGAHGVALALRSALEQLNIPHEASPVAPVVTVSIGLAVAVPDRHASGSDLVSAADRALYQGKQTGRNRICWDKGS